MRLQDDVTIHKVVNEDAVYVMLIEEMSMDIRDTGGESPVSGRGKKKS